MFLTRSEYDRGVNTFSPEGRLLQVEYALEAIKLGSTALAIKTSEGVVLASEKRIPSTLMEPDSMEKITKVADHVGCTASGLIGDSRILIEKARAEAANHFFVYDYPIKIESVALSVSNLALQFGDDDAKAAMSRPFGVAILFAGYDKGGAHVFFVDPSGVYTECGAKAIGSGSEAAELALKERFNNSLSLRAAKKLALSILKEVMEEKLTSTNVEICQVTKEAGYGRVHKDEIESLMAEMS